MRHDTLSGRRDQMDSILLQLLYGQLQSMGIFTKDAGAPNIHEFYEPWLEESLRVLAAHGYVRIDGGQCAELSGKSDLQALWRQWEQLKRGWLLQDELKSYIPLVDAAIKALPEILSRKVLATDILFPNSSMALVEGVYKGNPFSDHFNEILADHVAANVKARLDADPAARIRILEIGAGTGGTSASVFRKLQPFAHGVAEYCYTDLSRAFLFHAEREYGPAVPYLACRIFDVARPVAAQGIDVASYDMVIATNVLHATPNIRRSVRNAKASLRPGGLILLNELSENRLFYHLTFGLLEGWWSYEDRALRIAGSPVVYPETWRFILEQEGFQSVRFAAGESRELGQQIIVAESDGVVRQSVAQEASVTRSKESAARPSQAESRPPRSAGAASAAPALDRVRDAVIQSIAAVLRVGAEDIDCDEPFSHYGLDSILGVNLIGRVNETLGVGLSTTCIFDYRSVSQLAQHIHTLQGGAQVSPEAPTVACDIPQPRPAVEDARGAMRLSEAFAAPAQAPDMRREPIAVIGMSGRYAQSRNLDELWRHLENGDDLVGEVSRWDLSRSLTGTSYCRSGSFIEPIDEFAPMFFNISGVEAAYMDPQQRLFLEEAWTALEDAGYAGAAMEGRRCGVYVGCGDVEYANLFPARPPAHSMWGTAASIVPARISYHLNLQGPAIAVDTACSSSLVATHLACQGLWSGEIELALAGGVFLMCTPNVYKIANGASMLSPKGRCFAFDDRADGFVPGEGVGVVVLKRLGDALADGDHIYGVIRGSGINQDGSTNGITAPSALSQERLERHVYDSFGVDPAGIQMVEAHGTGTRLGDPIEYEALTKAFRAYTDKREYCAIGTIKSNLGHATAAAGVTGLIKILLSLRHRKIPASLNFESGNTNIEFAGSPFFVNTALRDWVVEIGERRRAALSAFGFSGTNAHMVIEEAPEHEIAPAEKPGWLVVLSARTEEELQAQARNLRDYCERNPQVNCANLSFTLLAGRRHFSHRWACVARNVDEFIGFATKWLNKGGASRVYTGRLSEKSHQDKISLKRYGDRCIAQCREAPVAERYLEDLHAIADLYVQGYALNYEGLFAGERHQRLSLPTYPFVRERYWVPAAEGRSRATPEAALHPLLHRNTSDFSEQRYSTTLTGEEFFLVDHVVRGRKTLPGVAYLEMAREAIDCVNGGSGGLGLELRHVVWARPIVVEDQPIEVHVALTPQDDGGVAYRIYSEADGESLLHSQGTARLGVTRESPAIDLAQLRQECSATLTVDQCYALYRRYGLEYGAAHRAISALWVGAGQVLARLELPSVVAGAREQYVLHPSLLDGALQSLIGLLEPEWDRRGNSSLPFALENMEILGACRERMWVVARLRAASKAMDAVKKFDLDLCDDDGRVCVRMKGFSTRFIEGELGRVGRESAVISETAPLLPELRPAPIAEATGRSDDAGEASPDLRERTGQYFKKRFAAALQLPLAKVEIDASLEKYGIDSIMVLNLTAELERVFGPLSKTLFFEHQTLEALAGYFVENHASQLKTLLGASLLPAAPAAAASAKETGSPRRLRQGLNRYRSLGAKSLGAKSAPAREDIAIIGLAGRYPRARDLAVYWRNLRDGVGCITEVPKERWDHTRYFDPDKNKAGKTYAKWGGFIDGVDEFDPLFFNISPRDAERIDPQERLFLQCAYAALEDAGYAGKALDQYQELGLAGNVGVYVGVMYEEYQLHAAQQQLLGNVLTVSSSPASIANRVSYFLNLHGPSMAVDTMCSSSLTAIHLACESLRRGGCELAIAGGVNVSIHPNKYLMLGEGKFASSKGQCESFGVGGDGYVPGEGVGAVLLKPLGRAEADGDHIHGVIRATAVNHGGKTNGYTVPNPAAQANVIARAIEEAGVDPCAISYVEAHGTGTALGDPIEIAGLGKAFGAGPLDNRCALGSVKSNIGHCESAAGIAGLTKVLLQMRHGQLVPSLHSQTLNPHIDFERTPFVVQQELAEWRRPEIEVDGERRIWPRIAGISSFGAGGSNAHVIIEEYTPEPRMAGGLTAGRPALFVLSAKTADRLQERARLLLEAIERGEVTEENLSDAAYTLQVGREAMEERLALVAGSVPELTARLRSALAGEVEAEGVVRGQAKRRRDELSVLAGDEDMAQAIEAWIAKGKLPKLAELWTRGLAFDWDRLYGEPKPKRVSLPTYPFAQERYWLPLARTAALEAGAAQLHPLLHRNTSDLDGLKYSSRFDGHEFFLADHRIHGRKILPGAAHLEMALAALALATGGREGAGARIEDVVWSRPLIVDEQPVEVHIALTQEEDGRVSYDVYGEDERGKPVSYSQGRIGAMEVGEVERLDLAILRSECSREWPAADCYASFARSGLEYGAGHRAITALWLGAGQVLARLEAPSATAGTRERYGLHPSLLDGALQSLIGLLEPEERSRGKSSLPFALEAMEVLAPCAERMWVVARFGAGSRAADAVLKFDLDVCDDDGQVCARLRGFSTRMLEGELGRAAKAGASALKSLAPKALALETLVLTPEWRPAPASPGEDPAYGDRLALLCGVPVDAAEVAERLGCRCETAPLDYMAQAEMVLAELKAQVKAGGKDPTLLQIVAPACGPQQVSAGLAGLLKSARLENPKLIGQVICVEGDEGAEGLAAKLRENGRSPLDAQIRYVGRTREIRGWRELGGGERLIPWRAGGSYLITGGLGGLGRIFAREIARRALGARLVLTGRRELDEAGRRELRELEALGAEAGYRAVDVGDREAVRRLALEVHEAHEGLNGILHSAGIIRDSLLPNKSAKSLRQVLEPKVAGLIHLDEASADIDLEWFICFSSLTGARGNVGQADYAAGNAFMDAFAAWRNGLVAAGERRGRTVSVNWPLWAEGGMRVDAATERTLEEATGMAAMPTREGVEALHRALASEREQVAVAWGDAGRMRRTLFDLPAPLAAANAPAEAALVEPPAVAIDADALLDKVRRLLIQTISSLLKVRVEDIDPDSEFNDYGFDSVSLTGFANRLNQDCGVNIAPTLFFEYPTLNGFAAHLVREWRGAFMDRFGATAKMSPERTASVAAAKPMARRVLRAPAVARSGRAEAREPVAIIGMSGCFPQAADLDAFWRNLVEGRDCISEIPADRWDWRAHYGDPTAEENKTNVKWGGFIDGVDRFDPLFFGVSPKEAELMDPQQRLLMLHVWKAIEDAGYAASGLAGSDTAIFVGSYGTGYGELLHRAGIPIEGHTSTGSVPSVGPNRMSYFLDLHGPSEPVETACSSSLVAIRRGALAIENGECEMAIVGGVNTIVTPDAHISFSKAGMLSEDGRCKTFSDKANGYARGEGVGMLLLKGLSAAERDGDHIYGLIRGTAENHGGRANSLTAPNPKAQAELIKAAHRAAGVDPRTVGYIEAHGTGTALGDPIEVNGLKLAFRELYAASGEPEVKAAHCGLGSVKSNIGHLELAAGVAGVIKVLLQMQRRTLAPSLHCETVNPYVDLEDSPFYIVREAREWEAMRDARGAPLPRRAGVSSFGFGGVNAHVVIEEYVPKAAPRPAIAVDAANPALIVLSAKTPERLRDRARQLLEAIRQGVVTQENLAAAAYTLQVGRDAMAQRLALLVASVTDLAARLEEVIAGKAGLEAVWEGEVRRQNGELAALTADEDMARGLEAWIAKGKLHKLAELWTRGLEFDWARLYGDSRPRRMSLPTYPFAQERYWTPVRNEQRPRGPKPAACAAGFDASFYDRLLDNLLDDAISMDSAVRRARSVMLS